MPIGYGSAYRALSALCLGNRRTQHSAPALILRIGSALRVWRNEPAGHPDSHWLAARVGYR